MKLDHLVIGTRDLEEGTNYLEHCLRCTLAPGGQHLGFGTHNRLLNLGRGCYLELIALDPSQTLIDGANALFGLNSASIQSRIANGPQLIAWATSCEGLGQYQSMFDVVGQPTHMRRGDLEWQITLRSDYSVAPFGLPTMIDWGLTIHPCERLPVSTVQLEYLKVLSDSHYLNEIKSDFARDDRLHWRSLEQNHSSADPNDAKLSANKPLLARFKIGEGEYFEL